MAKREDQPDDGLGLPETKSESSVPQRWIDAPPLPESADDTDLNSPRRPEGFNGPRVSQTEVLTVDAAPKRRRRSLKAPLITLGALVLLAVVGFFAFSTYDSYQEEKVAKEVQQVEQREQREKAKAIEEADSPFSVLVGDVAIPSEDPLPATVAENKISIGDSSFSVKDGVLAPTVNGCTLVSVTDVCLGARGKLGDGSFDVLLVKDISRTRILDNPSEFSELESQDGTSVASLAIDMGNPEGPDRFGALTANGTTGYVLIFPSGTTAERVEEVLKAATVV